MTRGAVLNLKRKYPNLGRIIVSDDGSLTQESENAYGPAYARPAYSREDKLDLDNTKLVIEGTDLLPFLTHQGHGFTLDRLIEYVKTPLLLTMDSDMRIVGDGLLEDYLRIFNENPNILGVGTSLSETFNGEGYTWLDPFFTLWNMEPLRKFPRVSFSNCVAPDGTLYPTGCLLTRQLTWGDQLHNPTPYKAVFYNQVERIQQLHHLRKFPDAPPDHPDVVRWNELMDGGI